MRENSDTEPVTELRGGGTSRLDGSHEVKKASNLKIQGYYGASSLRSILRILCNLNVSDGTATFPLALWEREQLCEQRELTTAGEGFIGSSEVKRSRGQAIYVILNLFQNLVFRCKDAKRRRRKASIEKLFPPIGEGAAQFCHCEGATHVDMLDNSCQFPPYHCEGVKRQW